MSDPLPEPPQPDPTPSPTTPDPKARRRGCVVGAVVVGLMGVAIVVAVLPNFFHFATRSKQSEAKANLKALYTAERSTFQEKDAYVEDVKLAYFRPEPGNRYAYFLAAEGKAWIREARGQEQPTEDGFAILTEDRLRFGTTASLVPTRFIDTGCPLTPAILPDGTRAGLGVTGEGLQGIFIGAAVGNIDMDPGLDCWSVATVDRTSRDGRKIAAGEPFLEASDVP